MTTTRQHIEASSYVDGENHINVARYSDLHIERREPGPSLLRRSFDLWRAFANGSPPCADRFNPYELTNAPHLVVEVNTESASPIDYAIFRGDGHLRPIKSLESVEQNHWHRNTFLDARMEGRVFYEEVEELDIEANTGAYYRRVILPVANSSGTVVRLFVVHRVLVGTPGLMRDAQ